MAARYGAETPVLDYREKLVCSKYGSRQVDMVVTGERRQVHTYERSLSLPFILCLRIADRLPLQVRDRIRAATGKRQDMGL